MPGKSNVCPAKGKQRIKNNSVCVGGTNGTNGTEERREGQVMLGQRWKR